MAFPARERCARLPGAALAVAAAAAIAACAPALKEAPPLVDLAGGGPPPTAVAAEGLLRAASEAFAGRTLDGARQAAALCLRAASADPPGEPDRRVDGVIGAVQALVWLSDHESGPAARESAATRAAQAAQWCAPLAPDLPACDYWLGAALGVQARERPLTGLSALPKIEAAFTKAAAADPGIDDAGPDRALALLYVRAPRWPTGPGDPDRGLEHARKAAALRPGYPPNGLALGEALAATGDTAGSLASGREALRLAEERAAAGDKDAPEWIEQAHQVIATAERHGAS
jgi:hypothetical protein